MAEPPHSDEPQERTDPTRPPCDDDPTDDAPATEADGPGESDGSDAASRSLLIPGSLRRRIGIITAATVGILALASLYTLYLASSLVLPIVIALILNFLFSPVVRALQRLHLPPPAGAAVVLLLVTGAMVYGGYALAEPAVQWVERLPQTIERIENQLGGVVASVEEVSRATEDVQRLGRPDEEPVRVRLGTAGSGLLNQTQRFVAGTAITLFLLYFLLAAGDLFLRKFVRVLPLFRRKRVIVEIAHEIEQDLSTYLFTYMVINLCLGTVVGFGLFLIGMPNPLLWGLMVAALNFVPYLGPLVGTTIVALAALSTFDSTLHALAAPALYFTINALEGNLITPAILGRRLRMNPVAIFISLSLWGWLWGIPGALLATPLLLAFKTVCDHVVTLQPLGEFIGR